MQPISITIPPRQHSVTITIHVDGSTSAKTQRATVKKASTPKPKALDYQFKRAEKYLESQGGFSTSSELYRKFFKPDGLYAQFADKFETISVWRDSKSNRRRPAVFYVLPDCVEKFKRHAKKQGWEIVE